MHKLPLCGVRMGGRSGRENRSASKLWICDEDFPSDHCVDRSLRLRIVTLDQSDVSTLQVSLAPNMSFVDTVSISINSDIDGQKVSTVLL
jgi:hypothetical protein